MKQLFAGVIVFVLLIGCVKQNNQPAVTCTYDACSHAAPAAEIQKVKAYIDSMGITASQHCSGVFYNIDSVGTGKASTSCSYVAVTYKGALTNGKVFDQNTSGSAFDLNSLIYAWRNVLPLLKEGGKIRMYVPPSLGYGNQDVKDASGAVVIPANSILIFDVRLIAVQ